MTRVAPLSAIAALLAVAAAAIVFGSGLSEASAAQGEVRSCKPFTIAKVDRESGAYRFKARKVRRSEHLRCVTVRRLLKAAYETGPLKELRDTYGGGSGRPIHWLRNGWRCGNGAGGASCFNAEQPALNAIPNYGKPQAVTAEAW